MQPPRASSFAALLVPALLLFLPGCASQGDFPSLAPRPVESELPPADRAPPEAVLPDDPALPAGLQPFLAAARQGQAEFERSLPPARAAVGRAGASGTDSWVEAQQAISRVEAARNATAKAIADLDAYSLDQAKAHPLSPGDLDRIRQVVAQLQAIADAQGREVASLIAQLQK
jgi:hypothetical protein